MTRKYSTYTVHSRSIAFFVKVIKAMREDACHSKAEGPSLDAVTLKQTPKSTPRRKKRKPEPQELEMLEENVLDDPVNVRGRLL